MIKNQILIFILFFIVFSSVSGQAITDTTEIELESLLNKDYEKNTYITSASKYAQSIYESPITLDLITSRDIESYGYSKLSEILMSLSGIYSNYDMNYIYLGLSGFGMPTDYNSRLQILIDGHTISEHVFNTAPIDELIINTGEIDRIEVIRGPGSVLYGGNAMFGVINIITKKSEKLFTPKIYASYGSFNTKNLSGSLGFQPLAELNINLKINHYSSDGRDFYFKEFNTGENNFGVVKNYDGEKADNISAYIQYKNFEVLGFTSQRIKDVPTAPFSVDLGSKVSTRDSYSFLETKFNHTIDFNKSIKTRLFYDNNYYSGDYQYGSILARDKSISESIGFELHYLWDMLPNDRIIMGIDFQRALKVAYKYADEYTSYTDFNMPFNIYSVYLHNEFQISSNLNFYASLRYDKYEKIDSQISPRLTMIYSPNSTNTLRFLWGTSYRIPTPYEKLYSDETNGFKSNPALEAEKISTFEINWSNHRSKLIEYEISLFYNRVSNFIEQSIDVNDSLSFYGNSKEIKSKGFRTSINYNYNNSFGSYLRYTYQSVTDKNDNKVTNSPSNLLKFGTHLDVVGNLNIAFEYRFESTRLTFQGTNTKPIHYSVLHLSNSVPIEGFSISVLIRNLFNQKIQYPGGLEHIQPFFTMPSRNYLVSINYGF